MRATVAFIGLMLSVTLPAPSAFFYIFVALTIAAIIVDVAEAFA